MTGLLKPPIWQQLRDVLTGGDGDVLSVLARGGMSALAVKVAGAGVVFAVQVVLARLLGVEAYGAYTYALAWAYLAVLPAKLGQDTASLRFVAELAAAEQWGLLRRYLRWSTRLVLGGSLVVAAGFVILVATQRARLDPELRDVLLLAALLVPVAGLMQLRSASLRAVGRISAALAPREIVRPIGILVVVIGVVLAARVAPATAALAMTANIVVTLAILFWLDRAARQTVPDVAVVAAAAGQTRGWLVVGLPLMMMSGLHTLLTQTDVLMIGYRLGPEAAGVYAAASRTSLLVLFGVTAVSAVAAPLIARLYAAGRLTELKVMTTWALRGILLVALPVALVLALSGRAVLGLFGAEFVAGYPALLVLVVGRLLSAAMGLAGFMMTMTGNERQAATSLFVAVIINVALNYVLISWLGIVGAALATALVKLGWNLALTRSINQRLGIVWWQLLRGCYLETTENSAASSRESIGRDDD